MIIGVRDFFSKNTVIKSRVIFVRSIAIVQKIIILLYIKMFIY